MLTQSWSRLTFGLAVLLALGARPAALHAQGQIAITLTPATLTLPVGGGRQLTATVSGTANKTVTWSISGQQPYGVGSISTGGVYWAPLVIPTGGQVTVTARSVANTNVSASAVITIRNQIPWLTSVTPGVVAPGPFTLTVNGSRFVNGAVVFLNGKALATAFISTNRLTAQGVASGADAAKAILSVANPGPGAVSAGFPLQGYASTVVVSVTPKAGSVLPGGTQQLQATVTGTANTAVTWSLLGNTNNGGALGTLSAGGLYTAPQVLPLAGIVTVQAASVAEPTRTGSATITIVDPEAVKIGRFLDQASTGPTPPAIAEVRKLGIPAYVEKQFSLPESPWPDAATAQRQDVNSAYLYNLTHGEDQLRQRVMYALGQIFVVSMHKNVNGDQWVPWMRMLSRNAFGNYRTLLREVTLSPTMGLYLDLANSTKPTGSSAANENYARELMQLFSIGLVQLNQNGTPVLDAHGQPIPTYTQDTVRQMALALTGWTFPTAPGQPYRPQNWGGYFVGEMEPRDALHDKTQKTLLNGAVLAPNQTIQQDLEGALDNVFNHSNVAPFVASRLVRALVTSNPSTDFVARISAVFNNDGTGQRGNLRAVVRAILNDPEARDDSLSQPQPGRLRTPVQHSLGLMRALGIPVSPTNNFAYIYIGMGEAVLAPPSVFGNFTQLFRIPGTTLHGPEFQIFSPAEAVARANFIYSLLYSTSTDLSAFLAVAGDAPALVNAVDRTLLFGRMSPEMRAILTDAVQKTPDLRTRVITVLYLTAMDGEYLIQR